MLSEFIGFACKKQCLVLSYEAAPLNVLLRMGTTGSGKAKLRLSRGLGLALACERHPDQSVVEREFVGVALSGEVMREAPAQAELRPICAGGFPRHPSPLHLDLNGTKIGHFCQCAESTGKIARFIQQTRDADRTKRPCSEDAKISEALGLVRYFGQGTFAAY
jgi:hypothetical protein